MASEQPSTTALGCQLIDMCRPDLPSQGEGRGPGEVKDKSQAQDHWNLHAVKADDVDGTPPTRTEDLTTPARRPSPFDEQPAQPPRDNRDSQAEGHPSATLTGNLGNQATSGEGPAHRQLAPTIQTAEQQALESASAPLRTRALSQSVPPFPLLNRSLPSASTSSSGLTSPLARPFTPHHRSSTSTNATSAVMSTTAWPSSKHTSVKNTGFRSLSESIRAEREDLREAAEHTRNVILDLGLDGRVKWVSPSWTTIIGTLTKGIEGCDIRDILVDDKDVFTQAVKELQRDDSRSQMVRIMVKLGPLSIFWADEAISEDTEDEKEQVNRDCDLRGGEHSSGQQEKAETIADVTETATRNVLQLEGQGIMVFDRSTGKESHTMWMLRPPIRPREITIDLPPILVESLGVGAEVLANYLTMLAEAGGRDPAHHPPPMPVLCRICERQITPWWFEKHTELCISEHKAEMDVQIAHEALSEHRRAIVKVLDALETRGSRRGEVPPLPTGAAASIAAAMSGSPPSSTPVPDSASPDWRSADDVGSDTGASLPSLPCAAQAEYKGLPIGPSPSSSEPTSSPGTPSTSRNPSRSRSRRHTIRPHSKSRSSFAPRRPLTRIAELILDLCDTALEINVPTLKATMTYESGDGLHFRTDSPQSDSRIVQVLQWQSPNSNTLEQEAGLAELANDTEVAARAKVDAVRHHRRIIEYAERIRVEFAVLIDQCITAAIHKAEKIANGELSDSSDSASLDGSDSHEGSVIAEKEERARIQDQEWQDQWRVPASGRHTPNDPEAYEGEIAQAVGDLALHNTELALSASDQGQDTSVEVPVSRPVSMSSRLSQAFSVPQSVSPMGADPMPSRTVTSSPLPRSYATLSLSPSPVGFRSHANSISKASGIVSAPAIATTQTASRSAIISDSMCASDRNRRSSSIISTARSPSPFDCATPRSQPPSGTTYLKSLSRPQSRKTKRPELDTSPGTVPADAQLIDITPPLPAGDAMLPLNALADGPLSSGANSHRSSTCAHSAYDHHNNSSALSSAIAAARLGLPTYASEGLGNIGSTAPNASKSLGRSASRRREKRQSIKLPGLISASSPRRESPGRAAPQSPVLSRPKLSVSEDISLPSNSSPYAHDLEAMSLCHYDQHPYGTAHDQADGSLGGTSHPHSTVSSHHRRRSSIMASPDIERSVPISPRLAASNYPPQKAVAPSIKDFEIIKPISKGAFGSVFLSRKKATGEYFAIKVLKKADMVAKNQITNVKAERAIMMWQGESEFVAKLYWTFSSKEYLYLVMEYLNGGDCASLIKSLGGLPEDWAKKYVAEVVLGVEHLHDRGIVHRDLKPDNLLIDQKGHLKLTDFGLSRMGLVGRQKRVIKGGTPGAPDIFRQGPFARPSMSSNSSRSASIDLQLSQSPTATSHSGLVGDAGASLPSSSYFALTSQTRPVNIERPRRSSGHRSNSAGSDSLSFLFRNQSVSHLEESPFQQALSHAGDDELYNDGGNSPMIQPLNRSMSVSSSTSQYGTPPQAPSSIPPPPMALFDAADHGRGFVGTPDYLAPETIKGSGQDEMCDWWSLGCILFEFLFGYPPFNAATPNEVFDNILHRRIHWPEEADEMVTSEARDLMNRLMTTDPGERLGSNRDEIYKNGGEEVRAHPWFTDINWTTLLEDKAQFTPAPENPEDTEYFDSRGATLQSFQEELDDAPSPTLPAAEYQDRPHDALAKIKSSQGSSKRGLLPLSIPPHVRERQSRRHSECGAADDFGNFTFKNLPVLEKANKDVIQKLKQEALQTQQRQYTNATNPTIGPSSVESSPLLSSSAKRTIAINKRSVSPSAYSQATSASPSRPSQPSSPLYVQFTTGNHERRKTSSGQTSFSGGSTHASAGGQEPPRLPSNYKIPPCAIASPSPIRHPLASTPSSEKSASDPFRGLNAILPTRSRSHTLNSQDGDSPVARETAWSRGHHKRRSQLFDVSPSSSDNEDPRAKALLKVQRRRQSSRRLSQLNLDPGPHFRSLDVLICEDHPVSRIVMERLFEKLRCRTITAVNGAEALRYALSEVQFDVIMTEFKLAQISGHDLARMIRETKSPNTHTPIVAVTGYLKDFPETHNFDALIEKPPTIMKITETVGKLCNWKPPPKDLDFSLPPLASPALRQTFVRGDNDLSTVCPTNLATSARDLDRADSVGSRSSYSYFTDVELAKSDEPAMPGAVGISRRHTEDWDTSPSLHGLGVSQLLNSTPLTDQSKSPGILMQTTTSSQAAPSSQQIPFALSPDAAPRNGDLDLMLSKRHSSETSQPPQTPIRTTAMSPLGGRDRMPMAELTLSDARGEIHSKASSPKRCHRPASKLGVQMLRTNSHGSVVSAGEELDKTSIAGDGEGVQARHKEPAMLDGRKDSLPSDHRLASVHENQVLQTETRQADATLLPVQTTPPHARHPSDSNASLPDLDKEKTPTALTPRLLAIDTGVVDRAAHAEYDVTPRSASAAGDTDSRPATSHMPDSNEVSLTEWPDLESWSPVRY